MEWRVQNSNETEPSGRITKQGNKLAHLAGALARKYLGVIYHALKTTGVRRLPQLRSGLLKTGQNLTMSRQLFMGDKIMKRITVVVFFTLASILGVGSAFAQLQSLEVRASVPFDFTVGNKQLPAGTYSIAQKMDGTILIQNRKARVIVMTLASQNGNPSTGCMLDFDKHAGQNFLHAVRCQSAGISINLPASRLEESAREEEAKLHDSGGRVMIAAK